LACLRIYVNERDTQGVSNAKTKKIQSFKLDQTNTSFPSFLGKPCKDPSGHTLKKIKKQGENAQGVVDQLDLPLIT
jgi:hypothetical protein